MSPFAAAPGQQEAAARLRFHKEKLNHFMAESSRATYAQTMLLSSTDHPEGIDEIQTTREPIHKEGE